MSEGEKMFEALVEKMLKPRRREKAENKWIRQANWDLVDKRTQLRRDGEARHFGAQEAVAED